MTDEPEPPDGDPDRPWVLGWVLLAIVLLIFATFFF